ncbi:MAG: TonB-dependent receptor [Pseudomonadota bacterium]
MSQSLRLRSVLAASVSAAAIAGVAAPAFAQDTTVGEFVVTAQKKEEAIQDVPIAVSAFSPETLQAAKIDGGPNLVLAVPNVSFAKGNFTGYNFQIRGVGSKLVAGSGDAGTGIHLNNAPLTANNLFESEFFDVERVEVLRGPQGTLYGRNATGGVVNLISAKPTEDLEAMFRVEAGNFGTQKVRGMVNVPLGEMMALRVAGNMLKRDGYGKNITSGNDVDDRDLWNTRITLAFNPSDTFRSFLMWDHFEEDDSRSRIGKQLCVKDPGPASVGGQAYHALPSIAEMQRGFFSQGCQAARVDDPNIFGTVNTQATLGGLFGTLYGFTTGDAFAGQMQNPNIRNIQSAFDPVYRAETDIVQFNITWDLTDELQLTALTGYSNNYLFTRQDYNRITPTSTFNAVPNPINVYAAFGAVYTGAYAALFPGGVVSDPQVGAQNRFTTFDISGGESTNWSQELRLQSNFDGAFNFNIGAIYIDFRSDGDYYVMGNTLTAATQIENALPAIASVLACSSATPCYIDPNQTPNRSGRNYYDNTGEYHLKSRAAFGEVYWQLLDNFKITGGLRYTHDMKRVENRPLALFVPGGPGIPLSTTQPYLNAEFEELTGRAGFDWKPDVSFTDETLIYLFYSRGYKAGGTNPQCSAVVGCPPPTFDPEFVDAWELGTKNTLMSGAMVLNLTAFQYDYIGYQVSKIVNRTSVNENIDAKIKGLELESVWSPVDGLRLNMNVGYLNTEIANGVTSIDTFNRTGGNPLLTLVKSSAASNCVVTTAHAAFALATSNALNNPFALLSVCTPATTATAGTPLIAGGPVAIGTNAFGGLVSDGVEADLGGNELPNAPHWTFSFGAQYKWEVGGGWEATLRGDYYKQTESFSRIYNTAADRLDSWENVNATFVVSNYDAGWAVELYGKNLLDDSPLVDTYLTDDSSGLFRNGQFLEPRTYGVSVTKTF